MARADSTIRVNIIGDAKDLTRATTQAEGAVGGLNKKLVAIGGVVAAGFAIENIVDFGQTALKEADRVGDATGILESQLGDLAQPIIDAADEFDRLGASEGDMLDLQVAIVNIGTAAGLTKTQLAGTATEAATTAAALALITDVDADTWIEKIGLAATGSEKALRFLGISVTDAEVEARALATTGKDTADALTDGELAAARLELILEKLNPRIRETVEGTGDLEQKQAQLEARWETLTGKIGQAVEGPLNDLLGWIIAGIDGWAQLSDAVGGFDQAIADALTPVARMIDLQRELIGVLATAIDLLSQFLGLSGDRAVNGGTFSGKTGSSSGGAKNSTTNVYVQGGSPEVIEQSVLRAINMAIAKGL